jgi:hypothetical protein
MKITFPQRDNTQYLDPDTLSSLVIDDSNDATHQLPLQIVEAPSQTKITAWMKHKNDVKTKSNIIAQFHPEPFGTQIQPIDNTSMMQIIMQNMQYSLQLTKDQYETNHTIETKN